MKSFNLFGVPSLLKDGLDDVPDQYVFDEPVSYGGTTLLEMKAKNTIRILQGLSVLRKGELAFESGGDVVWKGSSAVRGDVTVQAGGDVTLDGSFEVYGTLTIEAEGDVILSPDTWIQHGSNIHVKAGGEILLPAGCTIEDGVIGIFENK